MTLLSSFLTLYIWGVICLLLFFLFSIARFYEQKSGRRSFYALFMVPIALFALAALKYAFFSTGVAGDFWGEMFRFVGGAILGGAGYFLLQLMVGGRT